MLDYKNIINNIEYLYKNINDSKEGTTRLAFSEKENEAIKYLESQLLENNIQVRRDSLGNLFGRVGPNNERAIAFGSHLDSVENGGRYDGALGVFTGLECLINLKEFAEKNNKAFELICFIGEEGNPLGGTFGSRLITGKVDIEQYNNLALKEFKIDTEVLEKSFNTLNDYKAYLELHIEQGTVLENNELDIGIVTNITSIYRANLEINTEGGHSGTISMCDRQDSLVYASKIVQLLYENAKETKSIRATVGELHVYPNKPTVIPSKVSITIELRSHSNSDIEEFKSSFYKKCNEICKYEIKEELFKCGNPMNEDLLVQIEKALHENNLSSTRLVSYANHDANSLSDVVKTAMIFTPSVGGISHHPDEYTKEIDIKNGLTAMYSSLINFSNTL